VLSVVAEHPLGPEDLQQLLLCDHRKARVEETDRRASLEGLVDGAHDDGTGRQDHRDERSRPGLQADDVHAAAR
jgi:hypothetical protein